MCVYNKYQDILLNAAIFHTKKDIYILNTIRYILKRDAENDAQNKLGHRKIIPTCRYETFYALY